MLVKTIVNRPTTFFVIFALLVAFGLYTLTDISVDLFPEINPPVLVISTSYDGADPQEVERSITRPLESLLSNVSSIQTLSSTTRQGSSQITMEFTWGTNMDEAVNEVRDRLDMARGFMPDGAGTPSIFKFDPALLPIMELRIVGDRSPDELREIAIDSVQPRLEQLDGIAQANVMGGRDKVIRVDLPRSMLDSYGLTFTQVAQALRSQNLDIGAGTLTEAGTNYVVRTIGQFQSLKDLERAVIAQRGIHSIRLEDIGTVYEGFRRDSNRIYINGEPSIYLEIQKQSDANAVEAADTVLANLADINRQLPPGLRIEVISDTTQLIRDSLSTVSGQALMGALLAIIILLFFLRSMKSTLVVATSIPTSIIVTLTVMYFTGLTLNLMTLAGLALGVGLLVDNSIVILENIYRYREKGTKLRPSAMLGTQEMINAIVASTLTTVSVFLPLALFRAQLELAGELFAGLAFTVVISLMASLFVAIFLVPVLSSHYFPLTTPIQRPLKGVLRILDKGMGVMFDSLDSSYKAALRWVLRHKIISTFAVILSLAGGALLLQFVGFELFPAQEQNSVELNIRMPIGTPLDEIEAVMKDFEQIIINEIEGYEDIILRVGSSGRISIALPEYSQRIESALEIQEKLRSYFDYFPGVEMGFRDRGIGNLGGGQAIDIRIRTDNTQRAREIANEIMAIINDQVPGAVDPSINISDGLPQVNIQLDREKVYALGLNISAIGQEIRANLDGLTASRYSTDGRDYDIVLMLDEKDRTQVADLDRIFVSNAMGLRIPLSSFASYQRTTGPVTINREAQARQIRVQAGIAAGFQAADVEPQIQGLIAEQISLDDGTVVLFEGEYADLLRYGRVFIAIILVAVLLVFGVMAAQFESFVDPFIILFTIPLTLIGVIPMHYIMGINLSLFTAVGFVMLVGIVVNNGIVLVDYTNLLRHRGIPLNEACVEAGGNRLRPILMTNLTTILGLVPVSFLEGEGSELIRPIGLTVIGGLSASALLTLFFVPVVYAAFNAITSRLKQQREAKLERSFEQHKAILGETEGTDV